MSFRDIHCNALFIVNNFAIVFLRGISFIQILRLHGVKKENEEIVVNGNIKSKIECVITFMNT